MITVYTGCWGGRYDSGYIGRMFRMVSRHMEQPFRFKCITETRRPGWWGKVEILENPGPALWIDIDTVVTGQLDDLCITNADIRVAKNWAQSGHGGCQSSVMYWNDARHIAEMFDEAHVCWPPSNDGRLWGDQEYLTLLRDTQRIEVDYFDPAHVVSYKYHARNGIPDDARVVAFHGKPDPHECGGWVREWWD